MFNDPLVQYLLENSRSFTDKEREAYNESIRQMFEPTGENIFDLIEGDQDEGVESTNSSKE
jgi:hypothetical protein